MDVVAHVRARWDTMTQEFLDHDQFVRLNDGSAGRGDYDRFLCNVFRTHQNSPQFFGFIYALCPPESRERVAHNLLEELGVDEEGGESHPDLLIALAEGAGLADRMEELQRAATADLKGAVSEPFQFKSLRQMGLSTMVEVFAYEYMLAHVSSRIATLLAEHRGLSDEALIWFTHHSEVDIRHAEEALLTLSDYVSYYGFADPEWRAIVDGTLARNTFVDRYLAGLPCAG
jgi:pyrroloquinoline quinone (PQQ) biosynthesis protein C